MPAILSRVEEKHVKTNKFFWNYWVLYRRKREFFNFILLKQTLEHSVKRSKTNN